MINKFESSNIRFHKSLCAETGKLEGANNVGVQNSSLKIYPGYMERVSMNLVVRGRRRTVHGPPLHLALDVPIRIIWWHPWLI